MPSLAMAMRMRFRAFLVISMACLARGCWPSAVSRVMPASGSFPEAETATGGAEVPGCRRVDMDYQRTGNGKKMNTEGAEVTRRSTEEGILRPTHRIRRDGWGTEKFE